MSENRISNESFINPYNFISINDDVMRDDVKTGELSGTIHCELETLTPLFVPNTSNSKAFSSNFSKSYDFFSYEDLSGRTDCIKHFPRPIIPGSSLRGVFRSAYEAAFNGCLSTCDDENTLYRRTTVPKKDFGIIEKDAETGERVLYKATKGKWPIGKRGNYKTGDTLDGGVYLRGEDFPYGDNKKKNDAVMKYVLVDGKKQEVARFPEDSDEWKNLLEVWRLYQDRRGKIKGVNQTNNHNGYRGFLKAERIPVYFTKLDNGTYYYISPAAITKEVFSRTLKRLLKEQGNHAPCTKADMLCPSCALFGMVGETSWASRVMFKDAMPINGSNDSWRDWYEHPRALPVLSSPKMSATEFYMEDVDGSAYFNYDYYVNYYEYFDADGKPAKAPVRTLLEAPRLRGRKLYWHRKTVISDTTNSLANQRVEVRPVKGGKTFKFDIAYDRLTKAELETLLWTLTFGGEDNYAHKLGSGKPVGYGSMRISKAVVELASLDENLSLGVSNVEFKPQKPKDSVSLKEFLKMTDFSCASDDVKYPVGEKGKNRGIYVWFGLNKEVRLGGFNPSYNYVLPKPTDNDISLPIYVSGGEKKRGNRSAIVAAQKAEDGFEGSVPAQTRKQETKGTTIGENLAANKMNTADESATGLTTAEIDDAKKAIVVISNKSINLKFNKVMRKRIEDFIAKADASPDKYKDYKDHVERAKQRLK
jgi:hypothetical protein